LYGVTLGVLVNERVTGFSGRALLADPYRLAVACAPFVQVHWSVV